MVSNELGAGSSGTDASWSWGQRRAGLIVGAAMVAVGVLAYVLTAGDQPDGHDVARWREIGQMALLLIGLPTVVVGTFRLLRAGQLAQALDTPLGLLPRAERAQIRHRLRSTTLTPGQVSATRRVAELAVRRGTGILVRVGLAAILASQALGTPSVVRILLYAAVVLLLVAEIPAAVRDGRSAERFLSAHPSR